MPCGLEVGGGPDGRAPPVSSCRQKERRGCGMGRRGKCWLGRVGRLTCARSGKRKADGLDGLRAAGKERERASWA
jgi:hypothetical protein